MTWPRYEAICRQWEQTPPLAVSAAAIAYRLGALEAPKQRAGTKERAGALIDELGTLPGAGQGLPEWLKQAREAAKREQAGGTNGR